MISNLSSKESGCGCGSGGTTSAAPCSCGGAGCGSCVAQGIVRPRFFAGQLLTEDDLQLLSDYVGQKNRLHNRHLFGAGVVCGLEVTCDPCGDGRVIVHPGYALDCCGNDLTLNCAYSVDLNALVRKLRKDDCVDPCPDPRKLKPQQEDEKDTDDTDKPKPNFRYCLYIRYCEQPSDPVTPYSTGEECVQVGCEPTRIREGVSFELRCVDPHMAHNPLLQRLCLRLGDLDKLPKVFEAFKILRRSEKDLASEKMRAALRGRRFLPARNTDDKSLKDAQLLEKSQGKQINPEFLRTTKEAFNIVRDFLIERLSKSTFITDCTLKQRVFDLVLPRSDELTDMEIITAADSIKALVVMFIDYLRASVCSVLNPDCLPCEDSAVLLACLDWEECEVKRICNMERTFVLSPAAVRYWLPPLQLAGNILERLCCLPWEDVPLEPETGNPDLKEILGEEIKRIIKDSMCGISDNSLNRALEGLDRMFRDGSDNDVDMSKFGGVKPAEPVTDKGATPREPSKESVTAGVESTPAPAAKKASAKKTAMKTAIKGATKTTSKATAAASETSKPAEAAKATESEKTTAPSPTATPAGEPAPTATTPKGDEK